MTSSMKSWAGGSFVGVEIPSRAMSSAKRNVWGRQRAPRRPRVAGGGHQRVVDVGHVAGDLDVLAERPQEPDGHVGPDRRGGVADVGGVVRRDPAHVDPGPAQQRQTFSTQRHQHGRTPGSMPRPGDEPACPSAVPHASLRTRRPAGEPRTDPPPEEGPKDSTGSWRRSGPGSRVGLGSPLHDRRAVPTPSPPRHASSCSRCSGSIGAVVAGAGPAGADPTLPAPGQPATIEGGGRWYPRDDQGRALILHGYNIKLHGDRLDTIGAEDLVAMRRNGFTVLRMAMFWADMEPTEGVWNDQYFADLARVLDQADAAGVKVVLTMHQDSYSPAVGGYGMPDWTTRTDGLVYAGGTLPCLDPANQRAWQHFWEDPDLRQAHIDAWLEVVDRLGDEPALYGYDLLNEPCGQMNPGEAYDAALRRIEATQITPMLQRVTDAIRAEDTEHWIYLEGAYALDVVAGRARRSRSGRRPDRSADLRPARLRPGHGGRPRLEPRQRLRHPLLRQHRGLRDRERGTHHRVRVGPAAARRTRRRRLRPSGHGGRGRARGRLVGLRLVPGPGRLVPARRRREPGRRHDRQRPGVPHGGGRSAPRRPGRPRGGHLERHRGPARVRRHRAHRVLRAAAAVPDRPGRQPSTCPQTSGPARGTRPARRCRSRSRRRPPTPSPSSRTIPPCPRRRPPRARAPRSHPPRAPPPRRAPRRRPRRPPRSVRRGPSRDRTPASPGESCPAPAPTWPPRCSPPWRCSSAARSRSPSPADDARLPDRIGPDVGRPASGERPWAASTNMGP